MHTWASQYCIADNIDVDDEKVHEILYLIKMSFDEDFPQKPLVCSDCMTIL